MCSFVVQFYHIVMLRTMIDFQQYFLLNGKLHSRESLLTSILAFHEEKVLCMLLNKGAQLNEISNLFSP